MSERPGVQSPHPFSSGILAVSSVVSREGSDCSQYRDSPVDTIRWDKELSGGKEGLSVEPSPVATGAEPSI